MTIQIKAAKNVVASWASLFTHLAVGFLLSPYILHRLGDEGFGVWILVFSLTGYYGLLDLGIRQSVIRYVARFRATHDDDQLARFTNTCLFTYAGIAVLVLLASGVCAWYLPVCFKLPHGLVRTAQILVLLTGGGAALCFPLGVFAGILTGLQDFVRPHCAQIGVSLLRGFLIVGVLKWGGGLLGITLVTVGLNLLSYVILFFMARRELNLRFGVRFIDLGIWRSVIGYSSIALLVLLADKLRFQSDAVVIGMLASSGAITYFAIASKLVEYSSAVVQGLSQIFTPMSSQFDATGDVDKLRKVFILGSRACAMTIFPICAVLIILGKPIIVVWVGAKYLASYSILLLLLVPKTLYLAQAASVKILLGIGRHGSLASVLAIEGVANLVLSLILIRRLGVVGVAMGTAIPLVCTSLFYLPRHLCRRLNVRLSSYLTEAYLPPLALCAPLVAVLLFMRGLLQTPDYRTLLLQIGSGGGVYALGLLLWFLTKQPSGIWWGGKLRETWQGASRHDVSLIKATPESPGVTTPYE
jgi:O-antigen/teichoic acid export membrane protein